MENEKIYIKTDVGAKDGQNKCPNCGTTEISLNPNTGLLRCHYCKYEFKPEKVEGLVEDIGNLQGQIIGTGSKDIIDTNEIVTLKCSSCGSEVVIDIASSTQARCHWCRSILSINNQVPNGIIPDAILPFTTSKEEAKEKIENYFKSKKSFANSKFKKEFKPEDIMGVYLPYMIVDANVHANFDGEGEQLANSYNIGTEHINRTYYDANVYHVNRDFDLTISDLSVESSSDKLDTMNQEKTNNIINSIMPFDVENCVKYNANYLRGYTSEKRDTNIDMIMPVIETQIKDIARLSIVDTLKKYNRGVKWTSEEIDFKGKQCITIYLPVWLYSYKQTRGKKSLLHYVAVNARTKETMGSIPINISKMYIIAAIVEIIGIIIGIGFILLKEILFGLLFFIAPLILASGYFVSTIFSYANISARHTYEKETKSKIQNLIQKDDFIEVRKKLTNPYKYDANFNRIEGQNSRLDYFMNNKKGD